jgi:AraC family transcriptional regulator
MKAFLMPMLESHDTQPKRRDTREFHSRAVQRVISRIRERLDESISLREMASVAYMSRYHFNRTFRQVTGVPPRRFLSALRVQAATQMLLNTDNTVTNICLDVGYNSLGTFIRRFSGVLGISPMKLRGLRRSSARDLLACVSSGIQRESPDLTPTVRGRIVTPSSFSGPIFVGLFPSPLPEGAPISCAIMVRSGDYLMPSVPPGNYYIFAVGMPWPDTVHDYFRYDSALRGGGEAIQVGSTSVMCEDISLREPLTTDPPILLNLPGLLVKSGPARANAA